MFSYFLKDGNYYIKLHDQSCVEINVLCKEYEKYVDENDEQNRVLNEEGIHYFLSFNRIYLGGGEISSVKRFEKHELEVKNFLIYFIIQKCLEHAKNLENWYNFFDWENIF